MRSLAQVQLAESSVVDGFKRNRAKSVKAGYCTASVLFFVPQWGQTSTYLTRLADSVRPSVVSGKINPVMNPVIGQRGVVVQYRGTGSEMGYRHGLFLTKKVCCSNRTPDS